MKHVLIRYEINFPNNGSISNCSNVTGIFLPLCQNEFTDFNSSNFNISDINSLITDETFTIGPNILTAEGVIINGSLGILVKLIDYNVSYFELCLGNIIVNLQDVYTLNVTTIDVSIGYIFGTFNYIHFNNTLLNGTFECFNVNEY